MSRGRGGRAAARSQVGLRPAECDEPDDARSAREWVRRTYKAVRLVGGEMFIGDLPRMAAALAFRTIFGVIPVLVVGLAMLGAFASQARVESALNSILEYAGLSDIAVSDEVVYAEDGYGPPAPGRTPEEIEESAQTAQRLDEWIARLVQRVRTIPFGTITVIGIAILIYAAMTMLVEVERAFNTITSAPRARSWARRLPAYWTILTLGVTALVATFYIGEQFKVMVEKVASGGGMGFVVAAVGFLITVTISTGVLLLAYTVVPNARVRLRPALVGALIAAVLWEAGKWGFTQYLHFTAGYAKLYGSLALIPLFMLWVYLTWLIVLVGLKLAVMLQSYRTLVLSAGRGPQLVDPIGAVDLLAAVAIAFREGQPCDARRAARNAAMPPGPARLLLQQLEQSGLVRKVESDRDEVSYALARPEGSITAGEVMRAVAPPPEEDGTASISRRLRARFAAAVKDQTVAELIDDRDGGARSTRAGGRAEAAARPPATDGAAGDGPG